MRLIDADALIEELKASHFPGAPYVDAGISISIGKVCDAPTIEPDSEITECKDCVYSEGNPISDGRLLCTVHGHYMHYCSMVLKRRKEKQ